MNSCHGAASRRVRLVDRAIRPKPLVVRPNGPLPRGNIGPKPSTLKPGDPIILSVDPKGLLDPGMIARGEIVLTDTNNLEQRIPVILNANSDNPIDAYLSWIALPSNAIALIFVIIAASIATGRKAD